MCEYVCDYIEIASRVVTTRKVHECGSCLRDWPKGTRMVVQIGKTEGDFGVTYTCPVCEFALKQRDHGPLHFCYGHWWGDGFYDQETGDDDVYEYIKECLALGYDPQESTAVAVREMALIERDAP